MCVFDIVLNICISSIITICIFHSALDMALQLLRENRLDKANFEVDIFCLFISETLFRVQIAMMTRIVFNRFGKGIVGSSGGNDYLKETIEIYIIFNLKNDDLHTFSF